MRFAAKRPLAACRQSRTHFSLSLIQDFKSIKPLFLSFILQENVRFCNNPLQLFLKLFIQKSSNINNLTPFSQATN